MATIVVSLFFGPLPAVTDAITLRAFDESKGHFGQMRLWGAVGFALVAEATGWIGLAPILGNLLGGCVIDALGFRQLFLLGAGICLCSTIVFLLSPRTQALNLRSAHA